MISDYSPHLKRRCNGRSNMTESGFENTWFSKYSTANLAEHFNEIKTYAYLAFDQLDQDHNGFIDQDELLEALNSPQTSEREKSFISFLLNNQQAIADSFDEGQAQDPEGISRQDLEAYFNLVSGLISQ